MSEEELAARAVEEKLATARSWYTAVDAEEEAAKAVEERLAMAAIEAKLKRARDELMPEEAASLAVEEKLAQVRADLAMGGGSVTEAAWARAMATSQPDAGVQDDNPFLSFFAGVSEAVTNPLKGLAEGLTCGAGRKPEATGAPPTSFVRQRLEAQSRVHGRV